MGGSKKRKRAYIKAGRRKERPSQYGTFALTTVSWGFTQTGPAPEVMKSARITAGRLVRKATPPGASGMLSEALREKAMASIGADIQMPSLVKHRTAVLKM